MKRRAFLASTTLGATATVVAGRLPLSAAARDDPAAPTSRNFVRNGTFQDDWLSLQPQNQTLHWAYINTIYNRRDFHPDGWRCEGNWQWLDADQPAGRRRLILRGPRSVITQRLHGFAVHDDRTITGFPDAGGFPELRALYSHRPERLVRDLTLRVRLRGENVPPNSGRVELGLAPLGKATTSDPLGTLEKPLVSSTTPVPSGTFDWVWIEALLPASAWLARAAKAAAGSLLPPVVSIVLRFEGAVGHLEFGSAHLAESAPRGPNLLPNGGFESVDAERYPRLWDRPAKYDYFPPRHYYLFTTWHNALFDNRGRVEVDEVIVHSGRRSLKMVVPSGDEVSVTSHAIALNQREPRLIEILATVKTDRLCMLAIDGLDENGDRLDGFSFIHKAPVSVGTDEWRTLRQVFHPRKPVASLRLMLCARGANGYTLDATGLQPQSNVVGTVWWDDVQVYEPESTPQELAGRRVRSVPLASDVSGPHLVELDLGERLLGTNELSARLLNPGPDGLFALRWDITSPAGRRSSYSSPAFRVSAGDRHQFQVPYTIEDACPAYTEYRGRLTILRDGKELGGTDLWFATWPVPIDLKLGALYLDPAQSQFVRLNLGFAAPAVKDLASVRVEVVERRTKAVVNRLELAATADALRAQRTRIPARLRGDLTNLLLSDIDVSMLPVQPFQEPERKWFIRATALDRAGRSVAVVESEPFCRQAHATPQPAIRQVSVGRDNVLRVNGEPWMPWSAIYGFCPAYAGPADPGPKVYRNLQQPPEWSMYDGFTGELYTRQKNDFNAARDVAGKITARDVIEKRWTTDNLYSSTVFVTGDPASSIAELEAKAGGRAALEAYLDFCKQAPMVVATAPGIEETFGLFHTMTDQQLAGLGAVAEYLRKATGKPVMVSHGGYWNRLEFEKVPFFQIYDPETEPLYPANLHTDLRPLIDGHERVIWLRPQMYEDVPYERWRFHVYTELMRGCRGWQIAHGPGDASMFRGLHGELQFMMPIAASSEPRPSIRIDPWMEHWTRRYKGRIYVIAATTHGLRFGKWKTETFAGVASRLTEAPIRKPEEAVLGLEHAAHGIQYLPAARSWPAGSRLVQSLYLDEAAARRGFAVLVKANARFTHVAAWGGIDIERLQNHLPLTLWFFRTFYKHATGFLGWDLAGFSKALHYVPERAVDMGAPPAPGRWQQFEIPLAKIGAEGKLLDGVGFIHPGGRIRWGRTSIVAPSGERLDAWGDEIQPNPERLAHTKISVEGLKAGTRVRVLFEDRDLTAADGYFVDDFRGRDLYQRFGGGPTAGYGDAPVAVHIYEISRGPQGDRA